MIYVTGDPIPTIELHRKEQPPGAHTQCAGLLDWKACGPSDIREHVSRCIPGNPRHRLDRVWALG